MPAQGLDSQRAPIDGASLWKAGELLFTTDQQRLLIATAANASSLKVGPNVFLGVVADETERLALNGAQGLGCWPGDFCQQTTPAGLYLCISNHGEAAGDWVPAGGGAMTADNVTYDPAGSQLTATDVQAALDEVVLLERQGRIHADAARAVAAQLFWVMRKLQSDLASLNGVDIIALQVFS